jgi:integrase
VTSATRRPVVNIDPARIVSRDRVRKPRPEVVEALAESIKAQGQLQPILEHMVPLTPQAITLLQQLPRDAVAIDGYVFVGARAGAPLSDEAMIAVLRRIGHDVVSHGFRSSFRTWAAEQTNFAREVAEQSLAHTIADKVERTYKRTTLFDKRRALMAAWAKYCTSSSVKTDKDNVVAIGSVR